jgi:TPR repeat protein
MKRVVLALFLVVMHASPVEAGWDEGRDAYWRDDHETALRELRPLAELGHADAQHILGLMYRNGKGVPRDYVEAARWFRKAAEQGLAQAQNGLGLIYASGQGVPQDYVLAHKWFNLAASRSPPGELRDKAVSNRDLVAYLMNPAQIAEAQRLTREWTPKAP